MTELPSALSAHAWSSKSHISLLIKKRNQGNENSDGKTTNCTNSNSWNNSSLVSPFVALQRGWVWSSLGIRWQQQQLPDKTPQQTAEVNSCHLKLYLISYSDDLISVILFSMLCWHWRPVLFAEQIPKPLPQWKFYSKNPRHGILHWNCRFIDLVAPSLAQKVQLP